MEVRRALLDVLNAIPKRIDPSFNVTIQLAAWGVGQQILTSERVPGYS
ncbi:MAG: hypothetical protein AB1451_01065 [Nitrospirota bacterium]